MLKSKGTLTPRDVADYSIFKEIVYQVAEQRLSEAVESKEGIERFLRDGGEL